MPATRYQRYLRTREPAFPNSSIGAANEGAPQRPRRSREVHDTRPRRPAPGCRRAIQKSPILHCVWTTSLWHVNRAMKRVARAVKPQEGLLLSGKSAHSATDREVPSQASIDDWGRRFSVARARVTSEMQAVEDPSPLRQEGNGFLDELTLAFEELQVAEEELHVQTEELSTSRALIEAERLRYRTLFERAPLGYIVTDEHGVITDANRAAT